MKDKNKDKNESELEKIISLYGSLEAYNEEQYRVALLDLEAATRHGALVPLKTKRTLTLFTAEPEPWRFLARFFGRRTGKSRPGGTAPQLNRVKGVESHE
ncbi:MAG TPA: hypothetical protein VH186_01995 [Chloroflexia bacterium]|nr:hypothetical protein [Chloroflexia bacterium]